MRGPLGFLYFLYYKMYQSGEEKTSQMDTEPGPSREETLYFRLTVPDSKADCKATIIKTVWPWLTIDIEINGMN